MSGDRPPVQPAVPSSGTMGTRERPADRGRRRAAEALRRLGREHREARAAAGLSLRACAAASGATHPRLWRFEHGVAERLSVRDLGAWFAVLGLDLALRAIPDGDPIRDRAQLALLARLRSRIHPGLRWRTEVALPIPGDRRAWDAEIRGRGASPWRVVVEAETRIADGQAIERRLALKARDDPEGHVVLLASDTRANRQALASLGPTLGAWLTTTPRILLRALAAGEEPPGGGILLL